MIESKRLAVFLAMSELWKVFNMKFVGFGVRVRRFEEASVFSVVNRLIVNRLIVNRLIVNRLIVNRLIVNRLIIKYTPRSGNVMLRTSASNTFPYFSGGAMKTSYHRRVCVFV